MSRPQWASLACQKQQREHETIWFLHALHTSRFARDDTTPVLTPKIWYYIVLFKLCYWGLAHADSV
eukprot:13168092-Alexandrium_andersonii.AAC.1